MAGPASSFGFDFRHPEPAFHVRVPAWPDMAVETGPDGLLQGHLGAHGVQVRVSASDAPASSRVCAGRFLRSLVGRPGMPPRDAIYRAALSETTFLVIYQLGTGPQTMLHAHLLAAAGAASCVEAHFQRPARPQEDDDAWRRAFQGARID